ncbi:MAG: hypothetical protein LBB42_04380 [Coriobacteriales bacterium]|jgi:glucose-6-phosphate isomerase|nr:hypothetical protein [Coriobacteriales bacterium]
MNEPSRGYSKEYRACLEALIELKAPSRLAACDASLYNEISGAEAYATERLGWTTLCFKPPFATSEIMAIASGIRLEGLDAVVLLGQGGSSQASMTITKLHEVSTGRTDVAFRTMDSLSPVFVNHILGSSDPARTLYIVSSKSGSTIEPLMLERVVWQYVTGHLGTTGAAKRFVAITDEGSELEQLAHEKNYRLVLPGPSNVGGRFSALSAFALFPAALIGIDIETAVTKAAETEALCALDNPDNPALDLACFLYENYQQGRDKVSFVMPPSGQVFGLWIEQLVAESLGKDGRGILPNVEVDASLLSTPHADRCAITYEVGHAEGFDESLKNFDKSIPTRHYALNTVEELFARFIVWEYAAALLGILLKVNPFNQPDVEETKKRVKTLLLQTPGSAPRSPDYKQIDFPVTDYLRTVRVSAALLSGKQGVLGQGAAEQGSVEQGAAEQDVAEQNLEELASADAALRVLLQSLCAGDYFSINAFLPFRGYGRREALERMRNRVASRLGVAACLEIGPRYLHSTGQLHKGGPNTGVFLYLSADEDNDLVVPGEKFTLGDLAVAQARGDFEVLASRGRRAVHIHLASNGSETLSRFADRFCAAISAIKRPAEQ